MVVVRFVVRASAGDDPIFSVDFESTDEFENLLAASVHCRDPRSTRPAEPGGLAALDPAPAGEAMIGQAQRSRECADAPIRGGNRIP